MAKVDIKVTAAVDDAVSGLGKVDKAMAGMGGASKAAGLDVVSLKAGLDLAGQAFSAVKGTVESVINPVVDYAKNIRDLSAFTGVNAEETSKLINVADDLQIEYGTLRTAARKLVDDGLQPNIDTLADLSDQYLAIQDPVERSQFLIETFGSKAGPEMARMMEQGGGAIRASADEVERMGLVMDEQGVAAAAEYTAAVDDLEDSFLALKIQAAQGVIPVLADLMGTMSDGMQLQKALNQAVADGVITQAEASLTWQQVRMGVAGAGEALADVTAKTDGYRAKLEEVDPFVQNLRASQAAVETSTYDAAEAADASAARWQGLADAYNAAQVAAENNSGVAAALAAGLSGTLTKAQDAYRQVLADTQPQIDALNAKLAEYYSQQGMTVTVTEEAKYSVAEYELAQIKAATAAQTLAEFTGDNREEQLQLQVASEQAAEKVAKMGEEMGITREFTLDYTTKIQEANGSLAELNAKQAEAEAQLQKTTSQFLFQQVAASLTKEAQLELANSLGLIDDESYNAAIAMQELTAKYDTNGVEGLQAAEITAEYKAEVIALRDGITSMADKTVNIRVNTVYSDSYLDDYRAATGSGRASGGEVSAGGAYIVGEQGPEPFFPETNGYVMNNNDMRDMLAALKSIAAGGRGGGGQVFNINTAAPQPGWNIADEVRMLQLLSASA